MSGVLKRFNPDEVIYEMGDRAEEIFVVRSGAVRLAHFSWETGMEAESIVRQGEFFGVESALAKKPRDDAALASGEAEVLMFSEEEFETLISGVQKLLEDFLRVFYVRARKLLKLLGESVERIKSLGEEAPEAPRGEPAAAHTVEPAAAPQSEPAAAPAGPPESDTDKNILIVEDTPETLELLRRIIDKAGYKTILAIDGEKGLDCAQRFKPRLVLLDWLLPKMNGLQVCSKLKSARETEDIPVIFLSVLDSEKDVVDALRCGADDYMKKPFSPDELVARIERVLSRYRKRN